MKKLFIALCCAAVCTACSQQRTDQKLDAYFSTLDGHFMGSVVVQRDGQTIYQRSLGYADVENQIPCTAETQFRIGNCYAQDKGLKRSLGEAVAWYRKAAAQGCAAAKDMLRELEK